MIIIVPIFDISCALGGGALPDICIVLSPPLVVCTHSYRNFATIIFVIIIIIIIILHRHHHHN